VTGHVIRQLHCTLKPIYDDNCHLCSVCHFCTLNPLMFGRLQMFCARLTVLCLPQLYFNPRLFGKLQTSVKNCPLYFHVIREMSYLCVIVGHGWLMFEITAFLEKECLPPFPDILNKFYPLIHKCPVLFLQQFLNTSVLSLIFRSVLLLTAHKDHITFQKQFLKCVVWCCVLTVEKVRWYVSDRIDINNCQKCIILWKKFT